MDSHLVTIEIGIECCTYKRMQLDSLTFYKDWLKSLNTKSVKCRSTVKHNRMLFNNILKYIPYFSLKSLNHLLGTLNIMCLTACYKLLHNERLEKLNCHLLRETTLIYLKFRTYNDN